MSPLPNDVSRCCGERRIGRGRIEACPEKEHCQRFRCWVDLPHEEWLQLQTPATDWMCATPEFEMRIPVEAAEG